MGHVAHLFMCPDLETIASPFMANSACQEFIFHVVDGRLALEETVWLDELIVTACTVGQMPIWSTSAPLALNTLTAFYSLSPLYGSRTAVDVA